MILEQSTLNLIRGLAESVYLELGVGDLAYERMEDMIRGDEELLNHVTKAYARELIHEAKRLDRRAICQKADTDAGTNNQPRKFSKDLQNRVQAACKGLLDMPLMDGLALGEATREHVLNDSDRYQANAESNALMSRFLRLIAAGMKEGQTVEEVYTEAQLTKLRAQARGTT